MVTINLLPWRAQAQKQQRKVTQQVIAGMMCMTFLLLFCLHLLLQARESHLIAHISALKQHHELISSSLPTEEDHATITLPPTNPFLAHLLAALSEREDTFFCLQEMHGDNKTLIFKGRARSMVDLTTVLTHSHAAALFADIHIEELQQEAKGDVTFQLRANA